MSVTFITSQQEILALLCKAKDKWGMYAMAPSFVTDVINDKQRYDEIFKAAPWLNEFSKDHKITLCNISDGVYLFGTEEEIMRFYNRTVGEDGPKRLNAYQGPAHVYAIVYDNVGTLRAENW